MTGENDQTGAAKALIEIDPSHSTKYQAITNSSEGGK